MSKKNIGIIISALISFTILFFIHKEYIKKERENEIQNRIINTPIKELIKNRDIEALKALEKEGNSDAAKALKDFYIDDMIKYVEKEREENNAKAQQYLEAANLILQNKNLNEALMKDAVTNLSLSSDLGNFDATLMLANINIYGIYQPQNFDEAKRLFEILIKNYLLKVKDKGYIYGMLSVIYFNGLGTDIDTEKAKIFLQKALNDSNSNIVPIIQNYQMQSHSGNKKAETFLKELGIPSNLPIKASQQKIYQFENWAKAEMKNNNPMAYYYLSAIAGMEMKVDESAEYAKLAIKYGLDFENKKHLLNRFRTYAKLNNLKAIELSKELSHDIINR